MIKYMDYKGKKYPIQLEYYAVKMMKREANVNLADIGDNFEVLEILLYYALKAGHELEGKKWLWVFPAPFLVKKRDCEKMLAINMKWVMEFLQESLESVNGVKKKGIVTTTDPQLQTSMN